MPVKTEKELSPHCRTLWLKALSAFEVKNHGYAASLLGNILSDEPEFLTGRRLLRKASIANSKGKKSLFSGLSMSGMKVQSLLKKDPKAAIVEAEKMLESDPLGTTGNTVLKEAALAAGFPEIAAFALETLRDANPRDAKVLHELAQHYVNHDLAEKAVTIYNDILAINPNDIVAIKGGKDAAARVSMARGGWDTAESYRDVIKDKDEAIALEQVNRVVRSEDVIEKMLADFSEKYTQDPTNIEVVKRIAGLLEQKLDFAGAITYYDYAAQLTNNTDVALIRKATDLRKKMIEDRIEALTVASEGEGGEEAAKELEALQYERAEMLVADAKKRVERNPTDLLHRFELGEALLKAGQYTEAMPELQKARQSPNVRIKALNLLGQCMVEKGMLDLAEGQFKSAVSELTAMDDTKKELLYNLGLVYERQEKREDYLDCMKRIYESDFGYRDVAKRVEDSYGK